MTEPDRAIYSAIYKADIPRIPGDSKAKIALLGVLATANRAPRAWEGFILDVLPVPGFFVSPTALRFLQLWFRDATADPAALRALWRKHPGELLGLPTSAVSGCDALDIDAKHTEAHQWWADNRHRVPATRTHRTQAGGLHLVFQHAPGLRRWTGRPVRGVDGRAIRGSAVSASQMGRLETIRLSRPENLAALADLPSQWIDEVRRRRPPRTIVLDMDSSESPT